MKNFNLKKIILLSLICTNNFACAKVIFFDLYGVLFDVPLSKQVKEIQDLVLSYALIDKNPFNVDDMFFQILNGVPCNVHYDAKENCAKSRGRPMPPIMYMWQTNKMNYQDVLKNTLKHINDLDSKKFFSNKLEKEMMIRESYITFDLETRKRLYTPIAKGIEILKSCAAKLNADGTKKNKVYLLSNMDKEMVSHLQKSYPEIFNNFDGLVSSGLIAIVKPDKRIYQAALKLANANPADSIFIDDQIENIKGYLSGEPEIKDRGSDSVGITGILCKDFDKVRNTLENMGVIDPLPNNPRLRSTDLNVN